MVQQSFLEKVSSWWGYGNLMEYRVELRTVTSPDEVRLEDDPVRKGLDCLLYTSPSPRDSSESRMPSSA